MLCQYSSDTIASCTMSFAKPVNAAGVPADWPLTLFVARASSSNKAEEKRETLSNSLEYTEHRYARTYGDYHESLSSRVIMVQQKSNKPLPPTGHAVTEIREVLAAARQAQTTPSHLQWFRWSNHEYGIFRQVIRRQPGREYSTNIKVTQSHSDITRFPPL